MQDDFSAGDHGRSCHLPSAPKTIGSISISKNCAAALATIPVELLQQLRTWRNYSVNDGSIKQTKTNSVADVDGDNQPT